MLVGPLLQNWVPLVVGSPLKRTRPVVRPARPRVAAAVPRLTAFLADECLSIAFRRPVATLGGHGGGRPKPKGLARPCVSPKVTRQDGVTPPRQANVRAGVVVGAPPGPAPPKVGPAARDRPVGVRLDIFADVGDVALAPSTGPVEVVGRRPDGRVGLAVPPPPTRTVGLPDEVRGRPFLYAVAAGIPQDGEETTQGHMGPARALFLRRPVSPPAACPTLPTDTPARSTAARPSVRVTVGPTAVAVSP